MNNMYNKEYTLSYYSLIDEMKKKIKINFKKFMSMVLYNVLKVK